ncbi:MAG TPA: dephospho-CoA kinase [Gemmatimonadaceae bacterium]|nr:dephospho-CoA kinase [Gemmatimonadaceae bacterium]
MLYIGLTGNIASGKTEVARLFAANGATIIDADVLAREAVAPGTRGLQRIVDRWGTTILTPDGTLDRAALRHLVFGDREQLNALNEILHPEISELRDLRLAEARERGDAVVVYAVPLLFERNLMEEFDTIVLVDAPRPIRMERLMQAREIEPTEAMHMIASQMPAELKRARADIVIDNGG